MKKFLVIAGLGLFVAASAFAAAAPPAPEIDPASATAPFALLGGAILIIRSRIRR
jgi:hypothetical protein